MELILWRHAEAIDKGDPAADLDRPLTSKGERQAARMAAWLGRQLPAGTRVMASPARRAQQTAAALDRKFKTRDEIGPEGTVESLLHAVRWPDAREPVLVVGHQPLLGVAAAYLISGTAQPWVVRKGGIWWLRGRERDGELQVILHAVMSAELT